MARLDLNAHQFLSRALNVTLALLDKAAAYYDLRYLYLYEHSNMAAMRLNNHKAPFKRQ
jgi:hypothetical protein